MGAFLSGSDLINAIAAALANGETTVQAVPRYSNRMRLCSERELTSLQDNLSFYAELINDIPDLSTQASLYDYIKRKLTWRREVWANMQICAEAIELGFLIHQIASDRATMAALSFHSISDEQNPYMGTEFEGREALRNARDKITRLLQNGERRQTPAMDPEQLPRCSDAELDSVYGYTFDHRLFPSFPEKSIDALMEFASKFLSWRAETWAPLPPCIESYLLGGLVSRQIGDLVTFFALAWAPGDRGQNPFFPDMRDDATNMADFTLSLKEEDTAEIDRFVAEHYPPGS